MKFETIGGEEIMAMYRSLSVASHILSRLTLQRYHLLTIISVLVLASCSSRQATPEIGAQGAPDQSTPEAAVLSLLEAFSKKDVETVEKLMEPKDASNKIVLEGFKKGIEAGASMEITEIETVLIENNGRIARVLARFRQIIRMDNAIISDERSGGMYTLIKKEDKWYFIGLGQFPPPGWVEE